VLLVAFIVVVILKMTFTWLADEDSPYHFTGAEMQKWNAAAHLRATANKPSR
jgi:hypothetical protein